MRCVSISFILSFSFLFSLSESIRRAHLCSIKMKIATLKILFQVSLSFSSQRCKDSAMIGIIMWGKKNRVTCVCNSGREHDNRIEWECSSSSSSSSGVCISSWLGDRDSKEHCVYQCMLPLVAWCNVQVKQNKKLSTHHTSGRILREWNGRTNGEREE